MTKRSDSKPRVVSRKKVTGLGRAAGTKSVKPVRSRETRELERLRTLLNHSADAMMWVELPSGRILDMNAISRELLELTPKESPSITLGDILSAMAVDKIMSLAQETPKKSGRLAIVTDAFRCPSGMVIPVEMTVGVHVIDRVTNALIVARDISDRMQAGQALQDAHHKIQGLVRAIPDVLYFKDAKGRNLLVNKAFETFVGMSADQIIGRTDAELFPPDLAKYCADSDNATIKNKQSTRWEEKSVGRDGKPVCFDTIKVPLFDDVGKLIGLVGVSRDITDRKQSERALKDSESRYRSLFDNSSDAISILKEDKIVDCNLKALEMFQCTREQIVGHSHGDFFPPTQPDGRNSIEKASESLSAALQGHAKSFEWTHKRMDGSLFASEVSLNSVELGGELLLQAIVRDITERKEAEAELKYRSDFEMLVSEISTRFISIPREAVDHEIEEALEAVCRFTKTDAACLQRFSENLRCFSMTHLSTGGFVFLRKATREAVDTPSVGWWFEQISRGDAVPVSSVDCMPAEAAVERAKISADGIKAFVDVPLMYQGTVTGVLGLASTHGERVWSDDEVVLLRMVGQVFTNALQRKRFEDEREALEGQLRQSQKMQAVGQLAGGVAHDFNNLLQVINGYTEMAIELLPLEDRARANLEEAARASERAATLVRQLLTFGRRETLHQQYLDLNDIITDLMKMLRRVIGEHIDLNVSSAPGLSSVYADPGQIEQILMNLCVNARDAMVAGGTITLETFQDTFNADFCHEHSWAKEGAFVALSVSDTGSGIPAEFLDRIFEPFFTTKEVGKGTGLGLATVYAITERHGGFLRVESTVGKGTTFIIYFPAAAVDHRPTEVGSAAIVERGHGETILLAEDDELVRELTVRILEKANYKVVVACDGDEAVENFRARQSDIALAIIDVVMPKRNGRDVCEAIRKLSPDLPVLFSSGYSYDDLGDTAATGEHIGQIQKPFRPHELIRSIQTMLAVRSRT